MKMWIHNELTWNSHERSKFSHYVEHWILFAKLWLLLLLLLFLLGQVTLSIWRWCDEHAWWLHEIFFCVCLWVCAHVLPFIVAIRIFPHHWMGDALIKEFKLKVKVKCQNVLDIKFIKFWYLHRYIYLCLFLFFSPFSCSLGMPVPVPVIKLREQMLIKSIWIRFVGLAIKIRAMIGYFHMHQYTTTMPILMFNVDCVLTIERQYRVLYSTMMILARFAHTNKMTKTILLFVFPVSL